MIDKLKKDLLQIQQLLLCFKITLENDKKKYLTNSVFPVKINDITYYPASGISLVKAQFHLTSDNFIELKALYEKGGIEKNDNLKNACFEIFILHQNDIRAFVKYYCSQTTSDNLYTLIYLEPISFRLNNNIIKHYSKNCRASLGDNECGVDIKKYTDILIPIQIKNNIIIFQENHKTNGYYTYGYIYIENYKYKSRIIKHRLNIIELSDNIPIDLIAEIKFISAITGCNKDFYSCCHKFNNAINFRGEPFIPKLVNNYGKFNF